MTWDEISIEDKAIGNQVANPLDLYEGLEELKDLILGKRQDFKQYHTAYT